MKSSDRAVTLCWYSNTGIAVLALLYNIWKKKIGCVSSFINWHAGKKSSDLPIPWWCIIALWQLCQAKWYQSVWSVSCLLDPHRGHYQSHHAVITTPLVRQLVEYWCLRCQVSKDRWALTRLRWPMDAEADPCQLRWSACAKWMLIYCLSIDGSDLGGVGWLMAPNGHIIPLHQLPYCFLAALFL